MEPKEMQTKKRLVGILFIMTFLIIALIIRVGWIQLVDGEIYTQKAYEQQNRGRIIVAKRGTIYDRNLKELAISASVNVIAVNTIQLKKSYENIDEVITELAQILDMDIEKVAKIINKNVRYEVIKSKVDKEVGEEVKKLRSKLNLKGIFVDEDSKRFYPSRNLAAHIVGFTSVDNMGLSGMEYMLDSDLKGVPGKIISEMDASGQELPFATENRIEPQQGLNVVLTIDETIQHFLQTALEKAIDDNKALNGAFGIIMDPQNGDILAMVSKPDFDLNTPRSAPEGVDVNTWSGYTEEDVKLLQQTVWNNKAVADSYEPGSTFKAFTTAAGLEEAAVTTDTITNDFTINVLGHDINCWKPNGHGVQPFYSAVYNSCNPAFVKVAQGLGVETFYKYLKSFGMMEKTGIRLPSEGGSQFHKNPTELDMAVASFGQRFTITPIQIIRGYSALVNGGKLFKPRLVKEFLDEKGAVVKRFEPVVDRIVLSEKTSNTVKSILEGVVAEGTGKNAYVRGYRVGGKTGTSETVVDNVYIASFMGFAPADNPSIAVLVALDNPTGDSYYGGQIAAPIAGRVIEDTLSYLGVARRYTAKDMEIMEEEVILPDIRGQKIEVAENNLRKLGLEYKLETGAEAGGIILEQTPKPGIRIAKKSLVILYNYLPEQDILVKVPNVMGMSLFEARKVLNGLGINIKISGLGEAINQSAQAGEYVPKGTVLEIEFKYLDTD